MADILKELSELVQVATSEYEFKQNDICAALNVNQANWKRDLQSGKALADIPTLIKFYNLTKMGAIKDFLASHFNIDWSSHGENLPAEKLSVDKDLVNENQRLKQELEEYKKLAAELGIGLKKTYDQFAEFSFKKTFS